MIPPTPPSNGRALSPVPRQGSSALISSWLSQGQRVASTLSPFPAQSLAHSRCSVNAEDGDQQEGWRQPEGAACSPPVLGAAVLGSSCLSGFLPSASPRTGRRVPVPVLELEALTLEEGRGEALAGGGGRGPEPRHQLLFLRPPWALSRQNLCPGGQAGHKGATAWSQGVWPSPVLPSGLVTKLRLNLAPGLSLGDLRGPQVLRPDCQ